MKKTILAAVSALSLLSIPLSASARDRDDRRGDRWEDRRENRGDRREDRRDRRERRRVMVRERRWVTYRDGRGCIQGYWAWVSVPVWRYGDGDGDADDRWNNGGFGASYQYSYNGYDGQ